MKQINWAINPLKTAVICGVLLGTRAAGQVVLTSVGYLETFDSLAGGLPAGWTVRTGATSGGLGTEVGLTTATTSWGTTAGEFRNVASRTGLSSGSTVTAQGNSTDRALGIRQTADFGDPGAAFTLQVADTLGYTGFSVSFSAELLSNQGRSTTWTLQYALGSAPTSFTTLTTFADPGAFGATTVGAALPSNVNSQAENLWLRIVALATSTGAGSRDTFGVDDFELTYTVTPVPEPSTYAGFAGALLLGFGVWRRSRRS